MAQRAWPKKQEQAFSSSLTSQSHGPTIQWKAHSGAWSFEAFGVYASTCQRPFGRIVTLGRVIVEGKGAKGQEKVGEAQGHAGSSPASKKVRSRDGPTVRVPRLESLSH